MLEDKRTVFCQSAFRHCVFTAGWLSHWVVQQLDTLLLIVATYHTYIVVVTVCLVWCECTWGPVSLCLSHWVVAATWHAFVCPLTVILTHIANVSHFMWAFISINDYLFCTFKYSLLQNHRVPQTLVQFGVAAVRGVSRNKNITEFQLVPWNDGQKVVDDILAQLTPDERRKFKVGKDGFDRPSIELCPVGERTTFSLLMQCVCSVSVSQLRGPALSCVWTVHHL